MRVIAAIDILDILEISLYALTLEKGEPCWAFVSRWIQQQT